MNRSVGGDLFILSSPNTKQLVRFFYFPRK